MNIKTFTPKETLPKDLIYPKQTHSPNIVEIVTGKEDLANTDGLWTSRKNNFVLGVNTADCAPIVFYNDDRYGVIHAGWKGLCNGIVEDMMELIPGGEVWVGPILTRFEIQKDFCYEMLEVQFGKAFFTETDDQIIFDFEKALASILPKNTQWDGRDTSKTPELGSWRRDKFLENNRNVTAIWP